MFYLSQPPEHFVFPETCSSGTGVSSQNMAPASTVSYYPSLYTESLPIVSPYTPCTPLTPLTPSADVPESPFDVFSNYAHFKFPEEEYSPVPHEQYPTPPVAPICGPAEYTPLPMPPPPYCGPAPYLSSCGEVTSHVNTQYIPDNSRQQMLVPDNAGYYQIPQNIPLSAGSSSSSCDSRDSFDLSVDNTLIFQAEEAYGMGHNDHVLQMLRSNHTFDKSNHEQLQHLWLAAVYAKESLIKNKHLTAVDRYRLRKRNPFPSTIWEGEKTIYCLKKSARDSLTTFFEKNPYPSPVEKRKLSNSCELSYVQISNWFKNKRMREKENNRLR